MKTILIALLALTASALAEAPPAKPSTPAAATPKPRMTREEFLEKLRVDSIPKPRATPKPPTAEELRNAKIADVVEISSNPPAFAGKFVKLKFYERSQEFAATKAGDLMEGRVQYHDAKANSAGIDVFFPKEAAAWFSKLPIDANLFQQTKSFTAYARISIEGGSPEADLMGREIKTDLKGPSLIWPK